MRVGKRLRTLQEEVCRINKALAVAGLVTSTSGNASGVDREAGVMVIKPSGVEYGELTWKMCAVVELGTGRHIAGGKPSVDTRHHLLLYEKDESLGGIVHTHSNYATAFAAVERSIPCALTAIADEFGGEIPCTPYVDNEGDQIAEAIMRHRGRGPGILLGRHGVFTFDTTPARALKAAIMIEDVARTMWLAMQLGEPKELGKEEIEKWWGRYHTVYGQ
ncbi:MAG: class II aldolase/adducin family protein [bacterium]|nr:class II aldolase/adducin family protein [bacterium]